MLKNVILRVGLGVLCFSIFSCKQHFYIVRHAEKQPASTAKTREEAMDLSLSGEGEQRAALLAKTLRKKNIQYIFSTDYKRTKQTAIPTALQQNIPIQLYSPRGDSLHSFIQRVRNLRKGNVLIVAHSNTIDDLVNALSGKTLIKNDLDEAVYNKLFIVVFRKKGINFQEADY